MHLFDGSCVGSGGMRNISCAQATLLIVKGLPFMLFSPDDHYASETRHTSIYHTSKNSTCLRVSSGRGCLPQSQYESDERYPHVLRPGNYITTVSGSPKTIPEQRASIRLRTLPFDFPNQILSQGSDRGRKLHQKRRLFSMTTTG